MTAWRAPCWACPLYAGHGRSGQLAPLSAGMDGYKQKASEQEAAAPCWACPFLPFPQQACNILSAALVPPPERCADHGVAAADPDQLHILGELLFDCTTLAVSCGKPGWLALAAAPEEGVCQACTLLHGSMLAILKVGAGSVRPMCGTRSVSEHGEQLLAGKQVWAATHWHAC